MSPRELKARALQQVSAGKLERAEVLLRQVLTLAPRDASTWLRHAEVLKRLSRTHDAVASYRLAARILDDDGHHPRATAALKLAHRLLPDDVDLMADIIRSEMKSRHPPALHSLFPIRSPSQLLTPASTDEAAAPLLALPAAPAERSDATVSPPTSRESAILIARADARNPSG